MDIIFETLASALSRLEFIMQEPRFHPEGDALYHSLQVWDLARRDTSDPILLSAALLHDVGKGEPGHDHAARGAAMLEDIACPAVCWLVAHHLDLLKAPAATRARLRGEARLRDLEQLRAWDLGGRKRHVAVPDVERALGELFAPGTREGWLLAEHVNEDAY